MMNPLSILIAVCLAPVRRKGRSTLSIWYLTFVIASADPIQCPSTLGIFWANADVRALIKTGSHSERRCGRKKAKEEAKKAKMAKKAKLLFAFFAIFAFFASSLYYFVLLRLYYFERSSPSKCIQESGTNSQ